MSVEDVKAKFPIKTIPNMIGGPAYKAVNEMRQVMYANAATIPTTPRVGGGGKIAAMGCSWTQQCMQTCKIRHTQDLRIQAYMHNMGPVTQQRRKPTRMQYKKRSGEYMILMRMQTPPSNNRSLWWQRKPTSLRKNRSTWDSMASLPRASLITSCRGMRKFYRLISRRAGRPWQNLLSLTTLSASTSNEWRMISNYLRTEILPSPQHKQYRNSTMLLTRQDYTPWPSSSGKKSWPQTR